ncbi:unnamed protein product [Ectocarpus sp. 8 AP-2014]
MNPVAPAVCEFLSESLREGFALGLDRTEGSRGNCVYGPWQAPPSFMGEQQLEGNACANASPALLVRMERREHPLRRLLEACSHIFISALEMAAGPPDGSSAPASPTSPFKGGVVEEEGEDAGGVTAAIRGDNRATAAATSVSGSQQGWEAFNRSMDDRDEEVRKAVAAAAAAGAAAGGKKVKERELPAPMLEVLKVALSLLRRLSNRNLTAAGPFASTMQMWPSGHPQEEKGETDPERNDDGGGGDGDGNDDDDDGSPPAAGGAAAAAAAAAAADTTAARSGTMSPPQPQAPGTPTPMAVATPMAVEPPSTPDAPSRAAGARGGSGAAAAAAADSTPAASRSQSSKISRAPGGQGGK